MPFELQPSSRRFLCALVAAIATVVLLGALGAAPARASTQPQALLLTDSVIASSATDAGTGDTRSLEQQQAEALGYQVTAVDGTAWDAMTASQFAAYQLLIIGDPGCGTDAVGPGSAALENASTWEPVVMSSGGNKVLIGTDPTEHYTLGNAPQAPQLEANSLAYAGAVGGATGLYLDLGCSYDNATAGTDVPILDGLAQGTGQFSVEGWADPDLPRQACATNVNIVAATGPTSGLNDSELSNWNCSVHEAFTSVPSGYTPLALAPSSSGFASEYCADDVQTLAQACGAPYILVSGGGVSVSSDISLTPASQDVPTSVGSPGSASVTATVTSSGSPVSGVSVTFTVNSGPDAGQHTTGTTNSSGQSTFTVDNSGVAGSDSVSASFTNTSGNVEESLGTINFQGPGQVAASASNLSGTEQTALGDPTVATFTDPSTSIGPTGWTTNVNWGDGTSSTGTVGTTGTLYSYTLKADHTYAAPGVYTVTITITDASNSADTTTVTSTATITKGQLAVQAQPVTATEGTSFSGEVASFTNTDHGTSPSSYTATIDWGDGSSPTAGTVSAVSGTPGGFTVNGAHTYAEDGDYTVTVTVTGGDDSSTSASDQSTATITEATITVSAGTISATSGTPFSGQVATFSDGDTLTPLSNYTATVHWGDGTTTAGTITGSAGSFAVSGNHTYTSSGSFPLTVTVSEADGYSVSGTGSASTSDATFTVTGRGTLLLASEKFSGTLATIRYGNTSAPASSFSARISWGDGSSSPATVTGSGGTYAVAASHTFTGAGPYTVRITATDPASRTARATTTLEIPSSLSALSIPGRISARRLLCGVKRHIKCTGLTIQGSFRSDGGAVWKVSVSKSGRPPMVLGQITRKVTAGGVKLVFKVTNRKLAKRVYRMVRKHKLNRLTVQQVFTNTAGATSQTTLFSIVTK